MIYLCQGILEEIYLGHNGAQYAKRFLTLVQLVHDTG